MAMTAIRGRGPAYDVRPAGRTAWAPLAAMVKFGRNVGQGACAGLLTYVGAMHIAGSLGPDALAAAQSSWPAALRILGQNFASNGFAAPVEIAAAATLFLSAGRGPARLLGLFGFIGFALAYAHGVDRAEMIKALLDGIDAVRAFVERFQAQ